MSEALIGLIGVGIGGLITFLSGFFIESRKQKKENSKLKKEKLELFFTKYLFREKDLIAFYAYVLLKCYNEKKRTYYCSRGSKRNRVLY